MSRRVVVDWGFNVVPFDPQTKRRDFWGALTVGTLSSAMAGAGVWFGGVKLLHLQTPFLSAYSAFFEVARAEPATAGVFAMAGTVAAVAGVWVFREAFKPRERSLLNHIQN